jgi:hypothetical protein
VPKLAKLDKDLLDGLAKAGFKTTLGEDNSGHIMSRSHPALHHCILETFADWRMVL